jgi:tricarballylate dehydrogenase
MARDPKQLVIIGHGAAGLAAAVSAAEQAARLNFAVEIAVLEKAPEAEAGGNTRCSPSNMRMDAMDRIAPGFEADMREATGGRGDPGYFHTLATQAAEAVGWLHAHGVEFATPPYYLSTGPTRIQPVGGGAAIIASLTQAAKRAGVAIRYETAARRLLRSPDGRVCGVECQHGDQRVEMIGADATILASGGFQGDAAMMGQQFGARASTLRLISPGTRFDTGDGIRMAMELGAGISGDWNGMHIEPIDPRSTGSAPVVLVYPYGIVVDQGGRRFFDEGAGLMHETWEDLARDIHFERERSIAYAILDSRLFEIKDYGRAIRSEVPPYRSDTIEGLAAQIDIPPDMLRQTVDSFNAAAIGDPSRFDPARCDGLRTEGLVPPKSNWARPISAPPFLAYPLIGGIAYTFGGLATNARAEVLGANGAMPGLYAAGEITGHFHGTAPNAVAALRALVFGRIAGKEAAGFLQRQNNERALGGDVR